MGERPELDLGELLIALRRRALLIALVVAAAAGLGYGLSQLQEERYEATVELLFRETNPAERIVEGTPIDQRDEPQRIAATNVALASLDTVVIRVRDQLDLDVSRENLRDRVELEPAGQANILEVTASGRSPSDAARLANVFAEEIVTFRRDSAERRVQLGIEGINERIAAAGRESELAEGLRERRRELEVLKAVQTGDVEIAQEAIAPLERSAPLPVRNAAIGAAVGLVLAVVLALLLRRFDRHAWGEEDVAEILQAPILARVPRLGRDKLRRSGWEEHVFEDAFRFLRANLEFVLPSDGPSQTPMVIAVTSAVPGAGKTMVVSRLGEAFAPGSAHTVLMDGDLRRPMLSEAFDLATDQDGLAQVVTGHADPRDLLQATSTPSLYVLPAGPVDEGDGALEKLDGPEVRWVLERLSAGKTDVVLIDTAPVPVGAETSVLAAGADGVLLVVDLVDARRDVLELSRDQLRYAGAKVLGVVINRSAMPVARAAYGGYYERGPSARNRRREADGRPPA
jgi:capsular exopolysaccharide synthesis family protein